MKFKVGDKVKVVRNDVEFATRVKNGSVGIIKYIDERSCNSNLPYAVEFEKESFWFNECWGYCKPDRGYWCCDEMLELVERKPNECIVIYRKDSDVIALDKRTGEKSIAKCSPDDEFDFNIGAKLAFERLGEIKVGDYVKVVDCGKLYPNYHQKVKEIANNNADVLTKFRYGDVLEDARGEILLKYNMKVYAKKEDLYLLEDIDGGYILIDELGIEKCE